MRVIRANKVRQAISLWKAVQTATWRQNEPQNDGSYPVGPEDTDTPPYKSFMEEHRAPLRFHFGAINHLLGRVLHDEARWDAFFEHVRIRPVLVLYENFAADYVASTESVLSPARPRAARGRARARAQDEEAVRRDQRRLGPPLRRAAPGDRARPGPGRSRADMTPPNILYIHSHDTGRYVQPYGFQVPTPNIQLLADQGVLFRNAFCAAPTCSGSRASLLTGQYCHNNGMLGLAHRGWKLNDYGQHIVHPLHEAGYRSVLIGEQHISTDDSVIGFDDVLDVGTNHAKEVAPTAIDALAETPEPFFMSVGFFETHRDFAVPTSVRDTLYSLPPANLPDDARTRADMAAFKASARSLDQGIGAVLNGLHHLDLNDRTLIICTTDHGLAFPMAKATLFDRGTGVTLLMRGPEGFTGGKVYDQIVSQLDIYPTLCELAGVETPDFAQGSSLMPLVRGEVDKVHDQIFTEFTYHAAYEPQRAIRTDRWKYIRRFGTYPYTVARQLRRLRREGGPGRGGLGRPPRRARAALRPRLRPPRGAQPRRRGPRRRRAHRDAPAPRALDEGDRGPPPRGPRPRPGGLRVQPPLQRLARRADHHRPGRPRGGAGEGDAKAEPDGRAVGRLATPGPTGAPST